MRKQPRTLPPQGGTGSNEQRVQAATRVVRSSSVHPAISICAYNVKYRGTVTGMSRFRSGSLLFCFEHRKCVLDHGEKEMSENSGLVKHTGGCHCGAVRFEVWSSPDLNVFNCNCSICTKKQNRHFIVPSSQFSLLKGWDNLTTYTFNTHTAKHTFCKTCGVQSFYTPRSNPDGYGVAPHCLDPGTVRSVTVEDFCGEKWEESMELHQTIRSMSIPRQ